MPLMLWRSLSLKSTLPTTFFTPTSLLNPFGILIDCVLFVGKPLPLQVTVAPAKAQPATWRLAGLITTPWAWRSLTASTMLLAQSPVTVGERQLPPLVVEATMKGLVIPPKELPTSYIWPS